MQCHSTHSSKNIHIPTQMSTCHGCECDSPCPISRVLIDSLTHAYAKCENRHLCSINDHFFQNKSFFFYKSKSIGQTPIFTCFYQVSCVFVGSEFPRSHRWLRTPFDTFANFHRWIHMSNQEYQVFHPRGYLSLLAIANTRIFHFLFLLCNREAHFGHCPILSSPPLNTKHSVDRPCTHDIPSNTKHSVDRPCTHDIPSNTKHSVDLYHALTTMSCDVSRAYANVMHHCMLYHAT